MTSAVAAPASAAAPASVAAPASMATDPAIQTRPEAALGQLRVGGVTAARRMKRGVGGKQAHQQAAIAWLVASGHVLVVASSG